MKIHVRYYFKPNNIDERMRHYIEIYKDDKKLFLPYSREDVFGISEFIDALKCLIPDIEITNESVFLEE